MITDPGAARPLVVIPEYLPEAQLERLNNTVEVVYDPDLYGDGPMLDEAPHEAVAILIRNRTNVDDALLAAAPMLRV